MRAFIIVCDRCHREERKNEPFGSGHAHPGWASVWHGCVAPLGRGREYEPERHVCPQCLNEDEGARLVERQERDLLQERDVLPF